MVMIVEFSAENKYEEKNFPNKALPAEPARPSSRCFEFPKMIYIQVYA